MSNRSGAGRAATIGAFGGKWGEYAEAIVLRALEWLRVNQNPDGSWLSPGVSGFKEGKDTVEREWMGSEHDSKVYVTTLAALTLQVYYRFLPTYKPIETATEEASDGDVEIEIL